LYIRIFTNQQPALNGQEAIPKILEAQKVPQKKHLFLIATAEDTVG
jgi:hypothetical protein